MLPYNWNLILKDGENVPQMLLATSIIPLVPWEAITWCLGLLRSSNHTDLLNADPMMHGLYVTKVAPVSLLTDTTKWNQAAVPSGALNPAADFKLMTWASEMFLCSWNICESIWVTSVYSMCWSLARTLYGYKCRAESGTGSGLLCHCYI